VLQFPRLLSPREFNQFLEGAAQARVAGSVVAFSLLSPDGAECNWNGCESDFIGVHAFEEFVHFIEQVASAVIAVRLVTLLKKTKNDSFLELSYRNVPANKKSPARRARGRK
jgi:hypothetical protein